MAEQFFATIPRKQSGKRRDTEKQAPAALGVFVKIAALNLAQLAPQDEQPKDTHPDDEGEPKPRCGVHYF
ncbi:hypothetical protein [Corynebacterium sp. HMSC08F01]|uniref:hypothetical protein n=1 Tax=Corynebacterium sp. HMSC08F01 TaxID=1581139 RepID=UPI001438E73A|nr:hypothetical protein [Corynebacterium sp. HMSC08F01]